MQLPDLYRYWKKIENHTFGRWLYNAAIPFINPYTGALKAKIIQLRPGYAKLILKDRRGIRNHLNSIHAIAMTNLGEFASGFALLTLFTDNMRGIPIEINIIFIKKARGTLLAECTTQIPDFDEETLHTVTAIIKDSEKDEVARVNVIWKLGYRT